MLNKLFTQKMIIITHQEPTKYNDNRVMSAQIFPPILEKGLYLQKKIFNSTFLLVLAILVLVSYTVKVITRKKRLK
jgi:hypothetical protein